MGTRKLRQDTIKSLPYFGTDNVQCIYWDPELPCFGVRVYPSGRRSFVCSYRAQGRKRMATLGRGDVLRLDAARKSPSHTLVRSPRDLTRRRPKTPSKRPAR
jgi:hypothetical protein